MAFVVVPVVVVVGVCADVVFMLGCVLVGVECLSAVGCVDDGVVVVVVVVVVAVRCCCAW